MSKILSNNGHFGTFFVFLRAILHAFHHSTLTFFKSVVAELVRASVYQLKGRGFESGHCRFFFEKREFRTRNELIVRDRLTQP